MCTFLEGLFSAVVQRLVSPCFVLRQGVRYVQSRRFALRLASFVYLHAGSAAPARGAETGGFGLTPPTNSSRALAFPGVRCKSRWCIDDGFYI